MSKICVSINFRLIRLIKKTDTPPTRGTAGMRGKESHTDFHEAEWDEKKNHKKTAG